MVCPLSRTNGLRGAKNSACAVGQITASSLCVSRSIRRGGRVVTTVERGMRWPQIVSPDERCGLRTVKSCGLGASTLALTRQECFRILPGMVTRKPDHQREHEANRKTIAQGRPDVPVNLW
jgi:hypothetical protein